MWLSRPRSTVRRMMIEVACLGLCLAGTRFVLRELPFGGNLGTIYSKDYDETKFRSLRAGMSAREIESIMGRPLKKVPMIEDDHELWHYSDQTRLCRKTAVASCQLTCPPELCVRTCTPRRPSQDVAAPTDRSTMGAR
jgi:hypothetical protein